MEKLGRPYAGDTPMDLKIQIRMDQKTLAQADACAKKLCISRSEAIRKGIALLSKSLD